MQREPPTARVELTTAVAGPLASLGLGGLMVLLARGGLAAQNGPAAALVAQMAPVLTILLWLGTVNLLLAAFNMIPGFPLDGGRALRAVFWALSGSLRKATRWASWIGQSIAWLMIALGAVLLFGVSVPYIGSGFSSGLWLLFIGWFLNSASTHSYQQAALRDVLTGVSVLRLMRRDLPTVAPTCTLTNLVQDHVMSRDDQAFPVLDNQMLIGIVTLDAVRRVPREQWPTRRVEEIMTPQEQLATISPHEDASEAMNKLIQRDVSHLPVVLDNCEFLGLLRRHDIIRWLQLNQEAIG